MRLAAGRSVLSHKGLMMKRFELKFRNLVSATGIVVFAAVLAFGQGQTNNPQPFLQPITVTKAPTPEVSASPLVKKTGSSSPSAAYQAPLAAHAIKTSIPVLADAAIPGNSGVLVETLDGNVVVESGSTDTFNP